MEDFDETEEDQVFAGDYDVETNSKVEQTSPNHSKLKYSMYKPNFRVSPSTRGFNSTIVTAHNTYNQTDISFHSFSFKRSIIFFAVCIYFSLTICWTLKFC